MHGREDSRLHDKLDAVSAGLLGGEGFAAGNDPAVTGLQTPAPLFRRKWVGLAEYAEGLNGVDLEVHTLILGESAQTEYCAEYRHNGSLWGLNFFAIDDADAAEKLESIKQGLTLLGPLAQSVSWPLEGPEDRSVRP